MNTDSVFLTTCLIGFIFLLVFGCLFIYKKDKEWQKNNPDQSDTGLSILCLFLGPIGWVYLIARHDILEYLKNNK